MVLRVQNGTSITPAESTIRGRFLNVPYRAQEQTQWCWAACAEMIMLFLGINHLRQCNIAALEFGANCCVMPGSSVCNRPWYVDRPLHRQSIQCYFFNSAINFASVQNEVNVNQPPIVNYQWTNGGGHVAVLSGYYDDGDIYILDPWYGAGARNYQFVLNGYGLGQWAYTYYGIRR